MTIDINLNWKSFSVDMNSVHAWLKANAGDKYCGSSANYSLQVHFTEEPGDDIRAAVESYWSELSDSSPEATAYKSAEDRKASADSARIANIASATAKLAALGLSSDEIAALIG